MPHLSLGYSSNIKEEIVPKELFAPCHAILATVASAEPASCKSHAVKYKEFYIGDGNPLRAFVHLEVLLAGGRSLAVQQEVGKQMLAVLQKYFSCSLAELDLQITVEVKEFPRTLYFKIPGDTV